MKKITLFVLSLSLSIGSFLAQNRVASSNNLPANIIPSERNCGTMEHVSQAELDAFQEWLEPQVQAYLQNQQQSGNPEILITIPVVVHIIHNSTEGIGQGRNLSNARIQSQIDVLNKDFRKTNTDIGSVPSMFAGIASDAEVNFCLIQNYPTGHPNVGQAMPEPGVNRVDATTLGLANTTSGYSTTQIDGTIKPATSWNPNQVMNIWVAQLQGGLLGYAQFPNSGAANTDGVVIGHLYFGNNPSASPFHLGRTTTHEVGHYLGLRHIWGDANCGNDQVADTPTQQTSTSGCPSHPRPTCGNSGDNFQNYMDYTNDACMFMFTNGQKAVMQNVLNPSTGATRRRTLNAASQTLCAPSTAPILAAFSASATTIIAGQTVTFTNTSGGPNPITSNTWNFDVTSIGGVTPSTSSAASPAAITYNNPGTFTVSLTVGDGSNTDSETKSGYITVLPQGSQLCIDETNYAGTASLLGSGGTGAFGWISGHNNFDDRGKADKFPAPQPGQAIQSVTMMFAKKHAGVGGNTIDVKIWNANGAGGAPGTVLASQTVAISSLNLFPTATTFNFSPAVNVTGAYYVGITFSANTLNSTQDSVALITNADGETMPGTAWELWNDASWHAYSETPASWGLNMAHDIKVDMCSGTVSVKENILSNTLNIYPNPSKDKFIVALPSSLTSEIVVYNLVGEVVFQATNNSTNNVTIDLSNQSNGIYFVKVKAGNEIATQKLMLSK